MAYRITVHAPVGADGRSQELFRVLADAEDMAVIAHLEKQRTGSGDPKAAFAAFRRHVLAKYLPDAAEGVVVGYGFPRSALVP
jgi:hypothetical protein